MGDVGVPAPLHRHSRTRRRNRTDARDLEIQDELRLHNPPALQTIRAEGVGIRRASQGVFAGVSGVCFELNLEGITLNPLSRRSPCSERCYLLLVEALKFGTVESAVGQLSA